MRLSPGTQESLLALLCYGGPAEAKMAAALVSPELYDTGFRDWARAAHEFLNQYDIAAGEHTLDLLDTLSAREPKKAEVFQKIFDSLQETKEGINASYVLDQARLFARSQRLKATTGEVLDLLERGDEDALDRAEASLAKLREDPSDLLDLGTDLRDTTKSLLFLDEDFDTYPTGIEPLDRVGYGPIRKGLHLYVAPSNTGKSWWLINLGRYALQHRLRVLHITLEMSETKVSMRYMQSLFALPKRRVVQQLPFVECSEDGTFVGFDFETHDPELALTDEGVRNKLKSKVERAFSSRPSFIIKEFPTGHLTIPQLEAYLDLLEARKSFVPDLVLVDYADLMKLPVATLRESTGRLLVDLRGMAMARNIAVATCSQVNRDGAKAETVSNESVAEDYSKVFTADTIITYSQTTTEAKYGLARLLVSKARDEARHGIYIISQAYGIGQYCLSAARMSNDYWDEVNMTNGD